MPTIGGGLAPEPEMERSSNILKTFNDQFGTLNGPTRAASGTSWRWHLSPQALRLISAQPEGRLYLARAFPESLADRRCPQGRPPSPCRRC